jgi:site-specific recombinase XerD
VPDVRIHDLRHTLASKLVAQGANLPLVGRALNHSQVSTTACYAHLGLEPLRVALEGTAALLTNGTHPADQEDSAC